LVARSSDIPLQNILLVLTCRPRQRPVARDNLGLSQNAKQLRAPFVAGRSLPCTMSLHGNSLLTLEADPCQASILTFGDERLTRGAGAEQQPDLE
jgi:hypothetical protein